MTKTTQSKRNHAPKIESFTHHYVGNNVDQSHVTFTVFVFRVSIRHTIENEISIYGGEQTIVTHLYRDNSMHARFMDIIYL